ncbi:polyketide synthase [Paenibacillus apiarius]|uniref:polyketide synthase n=1 Tax=Paenibacillus apiarius TaxID=46240 RepID=UPI00197DD340|nr:polyketide synthase [Paenibacillus apiarius]MBN3526388.1 enoyl-CoA hydratase/isomerase family protein [Paenibacillus apiarius]
MNESVVELKELQPDIALVTMQDKVNKNTFTEELISGLQHAFETIDANPRYKVVILTGYDNYFASGGTQEGLIAIYEGRATFSVTSTGTQNIYSLPLDCKIPVIAAMQGHAIGGGLALGLCADFIIMASESIYTASFMKYGFTPGFGATCILPAKLGISLAEDFLISARTYRGAELEKRGIPFEVYPRKDVLEQAMELAAIIAEKPRFSLITLKDHLVADLRNKLPSVIQQELKMHDLTFHQPEVKEKIMTLYQN